MSEPMQDTLLRISSRIRYRNVGGEGVVVHLDSGRVIVVNDLGLFVLQQLATPVSRQALVDAIVRDFDVSNEEAEADLSHYLQELGEENLLEIAA